MKKGPYVYRGKLLRIMRGKKRLPNGRLMDLEKIEHPGAACIIPFVSKNKVIMLRQYRPAIGTYLYEFPAGTLEKGERPSSCARREVVEETGYRARVIKRIGKIHPVPGYSTEVIYFYTAEKLSKASCCFDPDEVITHRIYDRAAIRTLFKKGKIIDAKTICALTFCGWL